MYWQMYRQLKTMHNRKNKFAMTSSWKITYRNGGQNLNTTVKIVTCKVLCAATEEAKTCSSGLKRTCSRRFASGWRQMWENILEKRLQKMGCCFYSFAKGKSRIAPWLVIQEIEVFLSVSEQRLIESIGTRRQDISWHNYVGYLLTGVEDFLITKLLIDWDLSGNISGRAVPQNKAEA